LNFSTLVLVLKGLLRELGALCMLGFRSRISLASYLNSYRSRNVIV